VDWSSITAAQSLPLKVARATREGWSHLFTGMHSALNGWLREK